MSLVPCLNPENMAFSKYAYKVTIGYHTSFYGLVFADSLQDALDSIVDSWEKTEEENPGFFLSDDDLNNSDFSEDEFISGGNHGRITSFLHDELHVVEYMADSVELLASVGE